MTTTNFDNPVILITSGYDHTIRFWEALSGYCYRVLQHTESQVNALSITKDKRLIAAAGNPNIHLYDICSSRSEAFQILEGRSANVVSVGFQKDANWMFSGSEDGEIKIWDIRTAKCQRTCESKKGNGLLHCVILHPNQAELFCCDHNGRIRIWDLSTNSCSTELALNNIPLYSVSVSCDGSLLAAADFQGNLYVWNLFKIEENCDPIYTIYAHTKHITKCLISPDLSCIATSSADHLLKIWDLKEDCTLKKTLKGHMSWVWDCVFTVDSSYLISVSSDHTSKLWDLHSGDIVRHFTSHEKAVTSVALNDLPEA